MKLLGDPEVTWHLSFNTRDQQAALLAADVELAKTDLARITTWPSPISQPGS